MTEGKLKGIRRINSSGSGQVRLEEMMPKQLIIIDYDEVKRNAENDFIEGRYDDALEKYSQIISQYDPELVIVKFFNYGLEKHLPKYLMKVFWSGQATVHITQLLISILSKYKLNDSVHNFVTIVNNAQKVNSGQISEAEDPKWSKYKVLYPTLNIDTIIDMLNQCGYQNEASRIRISNRISDYDIQALIFEQKNYLEAATKIHNSSQDPNGKHLLLKFGPTLLSLDSASGRLISQAASIYYRKEAQNDGTEFVKLLWGYPAYLTSFLKDAIAEKPTPLLVTLYLELILPSKTKTMFNSDNISNETAFIAIIKNKDIQFNENQILSICAENKYVLGVVWILTRKQLFHDAITYALNNNLDDKKLIDYCLEVEASIHPKDWSNLFAIYTGEQKWAKLQGFDNFVHFIQKAVINTLKVRNIDFVFSTLLKNPLVTFKFIDNNIKKALANLYNENKRVVHDQKAIQDQINSIKTSEEVQYPLICSICQRKITYPCAIFKCGHIVHQSCSGTDKNCCPICKHIDPAVNVKERFNNDQESDHASRIIISTVFQ
ncbi:hypothetical protein TVAG_298140 [Trichomonas vaginalis G3]|uniref:RING-type domain-containing protein n=1 Tax=Trichomonas vaginalis (strain ATCC PRA-98 / G3) TaxID=412133 RepID=A2ET07_TRIV3|nr:regulation of SNARE complex assembly [Trichomonas vaginalis G3]EAY04196.1 hypothetical protein TVAG_298140 [Trichomonas vaginalis G3]KAI5493070.1 regulation of SNARE complex assembly [Trichomonas vaginalis G3]|eukprot:XP_001316419.1 hypothetical protein [Trichomonas vaginalis G3]